MGFLKTRKNKRYGYSPRYYNNDKEGSPFQIQQKFDRYRKTVGPSQGLKGKLVSAWEDLKSSPDKSANQRILLIVAALILLFLFIIEFDLSIFYR